MTEPIDYEERAAQARRQMEFFDRLPPRLKALSVEFNAYPEALMRGLVQLCRSGATEDEACRAIDTNVRREMQKVAAQTQTQINTTGAVVARAMQKGWDR